MLTGATGFVGSALLLRLLSEQRFDLRASLRQPVQMPTNGVATVVIGNLHADTTWCRALNGVDTVVHLAARVHVMHDSATDIPSAFRIVNASATLNLARQSAAAGVRRPWCSVRS